MILAPHAITGAAFATLTPDQPLTGFAIGFLSHFVLDAIPHWDYNLGSRKEDVENPINNDIIINRYFIKDFFKMAADGFIGLLFAFFFYVFYLKYSLFVILCGVVGACVPDALQFLQMKWKTRPLVALQSFHLLVHAEIRIRNKPILGIFLYTVVVSFVVLAVGLVKI